MLRCDFVWDCLRRPKKISASLQHQQISITCARAEWRRGMASSSYNDSFTVSPSAYQIWAQNGEKNWKRSRTKNCEYFVLLAGSMFVVYICIKIGAGRPERRRCSVFLSFAISWSNEPKWLLNYTFKLCFSFFHSLSLTFSLSFHKCPPQCAWILNENNERWP